MKIDFYKTIVVLVLLGLIVFGIFYVKLYRHEYCKLDEAWYLRIDKLTGNFEWSLGFDKWQKIEYGKTSEKESKEVRELIKKFPELFR